MTQSRPGLSHAPYAASRQAGARMRGALHTTTIAILLLGAFLRLAAFDETLIEPDQAAILDSAFQIAHLRYFPLTGMKSSVGVMQTGVVPLLAALPLLVVKRIIAVQWFFSALDILALAWLHRAVRRSQGQRAALVAALLYATAPWVILYARTIWYQTLIASLATAAFGSLLLMLTPGADRPRYLPIAMFSITMLSMVHLAAAPWGVLLLIVCVVVTWRRGLWRAFGLGLGLSCLIALPYLIHLARSSFGDVTFLLTAGRTSSTANTAAYRLALELITGSMIVGNAHGDLWDRSVLPWPAAHPIMLVLLAAALAWAVIGLVRKPGLRAQRLLMVGWVAAAPALFLFSDVHLQHFYLMIIFPAPFVLIGAWIEDIARRKSRSMLAKSLVTVAGLGTGLIVLIALWWSSLWIARIGLEAQGHLERHTRGWLMDRVASQTDAYLQNEPNGQVIVLSAFNGETSAFEWLRGYTQSTRVRIVPIDKGFIVPEGPTCYLLGPHVSVDTLWPVASEFTEQPEFSIPANPPWRFYCGHTTQHDQAALAQWTNGMSLLAANVKGTFGPGERLDLIHVWQYRAIDPGPTHFYNHLLLDGQFVSQVDGASVQHWRWEDGDVLLTYFALPLPHELQAGTYVLRVGMYTWPAVDRIHLTTGEDGLDVYTASYAADG